MIGEYSSPCYTVGPCLFYVQSCVSVNPQFPMYPSPAFPSSNHKIVLCESVSSFVIKFICIIFFFFQDSTDKQQHTSSVLCFSWLPFLDAWWLRAGAPASSSGHPPEPSVAITHTPSAGCRLRAASSGREPWRDRPPHPLRVSGSARPAPECWEPGRYLLLHQADSPVIIFFYVDQFVKSLLNLFWFFGHEACGIPAPWPGFEPTPPVLEAEVLTPGLLGRPWAWLL